ncbi:hypothetical protein D3C77_608350 [compost metagenome]
MGQGAVDPGKFAHHLEGLRPATAQAAEFPGNTQGEQAAAADGIALGFGRAALAVAFDDGAGKFTGQGPGRLQWG